MVSTITLKSSHGSFVIGMWCHGSIFSTFCMICVWANQKRKLIENFLKTCQTCCNIFTNHSHKNNVIISTSHSNFSQFAAEVFKKSGPFDHEVMVMNLLSIFEKKRDNQFDGKITFQPFSSFLILLEWTPRLTWCQDLQSNQGWHPGVGHQPFWLLWKTFWRIALISWWWCCQDNSSEPNVKPEFLIEPVLKNL